MYIYTIYIYIIYIYIYMVTYICILNRERFHTFEKLSIYVLHPRQWSDWLLFPLKFSEYL